MSRSRFLTARRSRRAPDRSPASGVEELEAELADIASVREALDGLGEDGLVNRLGDCVGASRAAVRFEALRT
jgi:hypothetical protein